MSGIKEELARNWLIKAQRDLLSAHELAHGSVPLLDTASYHCQQAAEKAVKAFLVFHDIRFEKTHDIELLVSRAMDIVPAFATHLEAARLLTPLATEFRYPGEFIEPEQEEFSEAYEAARTLYDFVFGMLPAETHP